MEYYRLPILVTVFVLLTLGAKTNSQNCLSNQFECDSRFCISIARVCDHVVDCADLSDETDCEDFEEAFNSSTTTQPCPEFQCIDGSCIEKELVCDGYEDCEDESDENEFICNGTSPTPRPCPSGLWCTVEATVNTTYLTCIDEDKLCDGTIDCLHENDYGYDEEDCPSPTTTTTTTTVAPCSGFVCNISGNCIPNELVCDGKPDCGSGDSSDEEQNCPTTTTPTTTTSFCPEGLIECREGGRCIEPWWVCDGVRDCPEGSDEENCRLSGI